MSVTDLANTSQKFTFQRIDPTRFALLDRFYRAQGYKVKCGSSERVYAVVDGSRGSDGFVAAVRLVPQDSGHYWLRNLLVASDRRGHGIATGLMHKLLADLASQECYCFALTHLVDFYASLGFLQNPANCPQDILRKYNTYRTRGRDWVLMGYRRG